MIKIAFIKFGGMAIGGTEKVLQTIAAELPKDEFIVDYFYCDAAPYIGSDFKHIDTDPSRVEYVKEHGVNAIKFNVEFKDVTKPTHDWINTDFWDIFNEDDYDLIQTGRSGHPEYPFHMINKTPIVDSIHLSGMAENKPNSLKTVLMTSPSEIHTWIASVVISLFRFSFFVAFERSCACDSRKSFRVSLAFAQSRSFIAVLKVNTIDPASASASNFFAIKY